MAAGEVELELQAWDHFNYEVTTSLLDTLFGNTQASRLVVSLHTPAILLEVQLLGQVVIDYTIRLLFNLQFLDKLY